MHWYIDNTKKELIDSAFAVEVIDACGIHMRCCSVGWIKNLGTEIFTIFLSRHILV